MCTRHDDPIYSCPGLEITNHVNILQADDSTNSDPKREAERGGWDHLSKRGADCEEKYNPESTPASASPGTRRKTKCPFTFVCNGLGLKLGRGLWLGLGLGQGSISQEAYARNHPPRTRPQTAAGLYITNTKTQVRDPSKPKTLTVRVASIDTQ